MLSYTTYLHWGYNASVLTRRSSTCIKLGIVTWLGLRLQPQYPASLSACHSMISFAGVLDATGIAVHQMNVLPGFSKAMVTKSVTPITLQS